MIAILYPLKMDNNLSEAYSAIYEMGKATPESGTGKYYNEKNPTKKQLEVRSKINPPKTEAQKAATNKYNKIKELGNQGKHKAASDLYKEDTKAMKDFLDKKAEKLKKEKDNQKPEYKNNPAFGDPSHHSNAKSKNEAYDNRYSDNTGKKSKEKLKKLEKKHGMKLPNHPQFTRDDEMKKKPKVGSVLGTTKDGTKVKYAGSGKVVKDEKEYNYVNVYLDELKKTTMGSYIAKASKDLADRRFDQGDSEKRKYEPDAADDKEDKKLDKREEGIARAAKKITKEGKFRKEWETNKLVEKNNYREKFETWLEGIVEEGYDIERWTDQELVDTFIHENDLWKSKDSVMIALSESDKKGKGSGKKDACYKKVKASASVWPSAYASGRLVQCRKKGAANYGKSSKKEDFSDWRDDLGLVTEMSMATGAIQAAAKPVTKAITRLGARVAGRTGVKVAQNLIKGAGNAAKNAAITGATAVGAKAVNKVVDKVKPKQKEAPTEVSPANPK